MLSTLLPLTTAVTLLATFTTAAPIAIDNGYTLRCNGESLSPTAEHTVILKLFALGATVDVYGSDSTHAQSYCDAGGCVYISLRSYDGAFHRETAEAASQGAQAIYEACGTRGGSGPVIGDGQMVVHLSGNWI